MATEWNEESSNHIFVWVLGALGVQERRFIVLEALARPLGVILLLTLGLGFRGNLSTLPLVLYLDDLAALIHLDDAGLEHLLDHQLIFLQFLPLQLEGLLVLLVLLQLRQFGLDLLLLEQGLPLLLFYGDFGATSLGPGLHQVGADTLGDYREK